MLQKPYFGFEDPSISFTQVHKIKTKKYKYMLDKYLCTTQNLKLNIILLAGLDSFGPNDFFNSVEEASLWFICHGKKSLSSYDEIGDKSMFWKKKIIDSTIIKKYSVYKHWIIFDRCMNVRQCNLYFLIQNKIIKYCVLYNMHYAMVYNVSKSL